MKGLKFLLNSSCVHRGPHAIVTTVAIAAAHKIASDLGEARGSHVSPTGPLGMGEGIHEEVSEKLSIDFIVRVW